MTQDASLATGTAPELQLQVGLGPCADQVSFTAFGPAAGDAWPSGARRLAFGPVCPGRTRAGPGPGPFSSCKCGRGRLPCINGLAAFAVSAAAADRRLPASLGSGLGLARNCKWIGGRRSSSGPRVGPDKCPMPGRLRLSRRTTP